MKNVFFILLFFVSTAVGATTYYIDPSGSDSNNGSSSSPWKTLAYACSKVTITGDIIHINAGTYQETQRSSLAVGVSLEGEGAASVITSSLTGSGSGAGAWTIILNSAMGTNGNQHISNIKMDGLNLTAWGAIGINGRSNVKIYNCTFVNFLEVAVTFNGAAGFVSNAPGTFGTGNELHDCIVTNCAGYRGSNDYGAGNIMIGGQNGLLIYNNNIVQTARPNNLNGYLIKYYSEGYNKGIKVYNNYLETAPRAGTEATSSWGFVLEQWYPIGGWEIYGNTIKGCLDLVNVSKGTYSYSFDIHDNTLGFDATPPTGTTQGDVGIRLEAYFQSVNIYRNHFKNQVASVYASGQNGNATDGLNMYNNIFENIGGDNNTGWIFRYTNDGTTYSISNLNFWNNIMIAGNAHSTNYGITIPFGTVSNVSIRNNIISGFDQAPIQIGTSGSGTNVSIENNIFYSNGNSNAPVGSINYTNYTYQNNLQVDPLFVSSTDFHLQSASPSIGKGINVGLTTDYDGNTWKNPPSIGAFESGSASSTPVAPVYQSSAVTNATPSLLEMTYNLTLANIAPAASSFSVLVNSAARTVNSVAISGTKVQLTLASPVVYGDEVTISYITLVNNPLQTALGGVATSISSKSVTNNCVSSAPVYISSVIENATPTLLDMTYSISLANIVPAASAFNVQVNSVARTVNSVVVSGTKVHLTLASRIFQGDIVKISYTQLTSNPLQTTSRDTALSITNLPAINNCVNIAPTVVITSPVNNSSFTSPANITINANASDPDGTISLVEFYNGTIRIGSSSEAPYSFNWSNVDVGTYSLTIIVTDNLNTKTTSSAISVSVINDQVVSNEAPIVQIFNPIKGNVYNQLSSITIDATATDPDGTISKVEFYNGAVRLVELTSPPYTYLWKDVAAGNYTISAIATDNQNATTISAPVEFVVGENVKYDANSDIVNLYPNPNNGQFSVEFANPLQSETSEIIISDLSGKQVYNEPISNEEILKHFDLSDIKSGMYVMMIKNKEISFTKKFIKE
jgi:uncharacterized repeat protein (TIGR02059 family)